MRTFKTPAPWGLGPGPANLYSIDGALCAINMWLELTPVRRETSLERDLMLTVRDLLERIPAVPCEADLTSAKRALKGMVKYSRSRQAESARIESYLSQVKGAPRRPMARSR